MALSASALMSSASAETVAEFVWSQVNGHGFDSLDETGSWIVASGWQNYTGDALMGCGWSHRGVLYSPWTKDGSVTVYRTAGGSLPVLSPETSVGNNNATVAVTPDGRWCYLLTDAGLYRYDLTADTTGTWSLVDAQTTHAPASLAVDEAGHVFASIRDNGYSYYGGREDIRCYDGETGESVWKVRFNTTDANDPTGLCWNPQDNYLYWITTSRHVFRMPANGDLAKLESYTFSGEEGGDQKGGWGAGLCVLNGTFYMNYYYSSEGRVTSFVWPLEDAAPSDFKAIMLSTRASASSKGLVVARTLPAAQWRLVDDEPTLVGRCSFRKDAIEPSAFGVKSGAGYFAGPGAFAYLSGSSTLVPATGDFTLNFRIGVPALDAVPAAPRCLLSNDAGQLGALSVVADQGEANKVGLRFTKADGSVVTVAGDTVADGEWHSVAVCRRGGTALELWLDGVLDGSATIEATDTIARDADWHFGCSGDEMAGYIGADAFLGEIRYYSSAMPKGELADLGTWRAYADLPSDPGAPTEHDPLPSAFGTEVAHASAETPFDAPGVFVAANGDYYASVGRLCAVGNPAGGTAIYRSADKGANWSLFSTIPASGVTLYEANGVLCAFGQKGARTFAIWKHAGGVWTEAASAAAETGIFRMHPGRIAFDTVRNRVIKPVVRKFLPYSNADRLAWVCFRCDGTDVTDGSVMVVENVNLEYGFPTVADMQPGHAIYSDGTAYLMNSIAQDAHNNIPRCADRLMFAGVSLNYEVEKNPYGIIGNYKDFGIFRGGTEPFGLAYDGSGKLLRSVSIADGKLVLQASKTFRDWMPCGEIGLPDGGTVYAPSIAIDGDDLVMATGVRYDDGAGGADLTEGGVSLAFRKISGFRTAYVPEEPTRYSQKIVYSVNERGSCEQVWKASDGRWYQDDYFKKMYDQLGNDTLMSPMGICYAQKHYFLCPCSSSKLYVMGRTATYQKTITLPASGWWNEVVADPKGGHLTVCIDGGTIASVDWRAGTARTLVDKGGASQHNYSKIAVGLDGTIYATGRTTDYSTYYLDRITADGGSVETLLSKSSSDSDGYGGVALDDEGKTLYVMTNKGVLRSIDLATKTVTDLANLGLSDDSACMMLRHHDGKLYFAGNTGKLSQVDLATGAYEPALGYVFQVRGMTFVDNPKLGTAVIIR